MKKTSIDRAIEKLEFDKRVIDLAIEKLKQQQSTVTTRGKRGKKKSGAENILQAV